MPEKTLQKIRSTSKKKKNEMRSLDVAFNVMIYYTSRVAGFLLLQQLSKSSLLHWTERS